MPKLDQLTMATIKDRHQGCFILANDAGYDDTNGCNVLDVLVWATKADSQNTRSGHWPPGEAGPKSKQDPDAHQRRGLVSWSA